MKLLTPTKGRVLVEPILDSGMRGVIHIPENSRDASSEAIVVNLGVNCEAEVKIGDRIVMNRFSGQEVHIAGKPYKILDKEEILATIE